MVHAYGLLPGFVVREGQRTKAAMLDGQISNTVTDGSLTAGELVQIRATELGKKGVLVVIGPVCQRRSRHRALRAKIRFAFDKSTMKGPDLDVIEGAVAGWLQPVAVSEVAEQCGPNSGTPVVRWTAETAAGEIERQLGEPDARAETADGEVLVYGDLRLELRGGRLAGFRGRP